MITYLQILNLIKDTALAQPNVNSVVREFLDLNREDAKYSAVVIQDRDGNRDRIEEQGYITYTWHLGYVDRLTYDESNRDDIISTGINIINNIVNTIRNTWFPELEVSIVDRINTFNQRFTAQCAGVYVVLAVNAQVSDCVDSESNDLYDKFEMTFTKNGHYHYVPSGRPIDEIDITIDCPEPKKEELLKETIISNGSYSYDPKEGSVFNRADITVDVHPSISLSETYISNGSYNITGEFNGGVITVDVPISGWDQKSMTEGTNIITNLDNSASFVASNAFYSDRTIQTVNLPYATSVGNNAFVGCSNLTTVSLPECKTIGSSAFNGCTNLKTINIPLCSSIGNSAFYMCSNFLSELNLPKCMYIGSSAFERCYSLATVNIPICKSTGIYTFRRCSSLNSLILCTDAYWTIPYNGILEGTPIESGTGSIYVRSDTYSAWITSNGWSSLSDRFVSVETSGFALSFSEGTVYGTTTLLYNGFLSYLGVSKSDITKVILPECIYIESSIFRSYSVLSQISFPRCEYIGDSTFYYCTSLSNINLPICSYIGVEAFRHCTSLTQVDLPLCKYIARQAFMEGYSANYNLPVCSYIGIDAFRTYSFITITLGYSSVVGVSGHPFESYNKNVSIYVPNSLVDAYKSAPIWSEYSNRIFTIPS